MPSSTHILRTIRRNVSKMEMSPDDVDMIFTGFRGAKKERDAYRLSYQYKHTGRPASPKENETGDECTSAIRIKGLPDDIASTMCDTYTDFSLTPLMIDTIQSFVACPENGSSNWPLFLNYIEYGDDAALRGYTVTLFGACSGTGDLYKVFKNLQTINPNHTLCKYIPALHKARRGNIEGLEGLANVNGDPTKAKADWSKWTPNGRTHLDHIQGDLATLPLDDQDWARAVWTTYDAEYWKSAADFCLKRGPCKHRPGPVLKSPLALGIMVDTSLNHGPAWYWKEEKTWTKIFSGMRRPETDDVKTWLGEFLESRCRLLKSGFMDLDWSKTGDRCTLWKKALDEDNWTLARPIHLPKSKGKIWQDDLVLE